MLPYTLGSSAIKHNYRRATYRNRDYHPPAILPVSGEKCCSFKGVIQMIKSDVLSGILIGIVVGLVFTTPLTPHLGVIVILAVVFGTRLLSMK